VSLFNENSKTVKHLFKIAFNLMIENYIEKRANLKFKSLLINIDLENNFFGTRK
jgi:hypothetical protein